jgi:hypothetical protein
MRGRGFQKVFSKILNLKELKKTGCHLLRPKDNLGEQVAVGEAGILGPTCSKGSKLAWEPDGLYLSWYL